MPDLMINPEKLHETAHSFDKATEILMKLLKDLNEAVEDLEKEWEGASRQVFYKQYKELQKYLDAFSSISSNIAKELNLMAERFEKLDNEEFDIK